MLLCSESIAIARCIWRRCAIMRPVIGLPADSLINLYSCVDLICLSPWLRCHSHYEWSCSYLPTWRSFITQRENPSLQENEHRQSSSNRGRVDSWFVYNMEDILIQLSKDAIAPKYSYIRKACKDANGMMKVFQYSYLDIFLRSNLDTILLYSIYVFQ